MIEKAQQEFILRGKLKRNISLKTSINQDEYYFAPLQVEETEKDGQKVENEVDLITIMFWKKNFKEEIQKSISELKENQTISVLGYYQLVNDGRLWHVTELIEVEENDLFI